MAEIVYVLTNEAMPDIVKIGRTSTSVEDRISTLSSHSGVPLPFECYFAAVVPNATILERKLHRLFHNNEVNPRREFYRVDPERVVLAITIGDFEEITPGESRLDEEDQIALSRAKARRPRISLERIGIYSGDTLELSRDDSITVSVISGNRVIYQDEELSLSEAALRALQSLGYRTSSVSGSDYWMFEGETLDERRRRIEAEQFEE